MTKLDMLLAMGVPFLLLVLPLLALESRRLLRNQLGGGATPIPKESLLDKVNRRQATSL